MTTLLQVMNKFNVPNKEKFKDLFDLKIEDKILEGTLKVEEDIYHVKNDEEVCMFCFDCSEPEVIIGIEHNGFFVGESYGAFGSMGFVD